MLSNYTPLQLRPLSREAQLIRPHPQFAGHVKLNHPAVEVMTDLQNTLPVTITPEADIEAAEAHMRNRGVRLLFVVDEEGALLGLITATDLLGEKPLQFLERHGGVHRDIRVRDLMTSRDDLEVLLMSEVLTARVGHVVATLKACGRQHALVVDTVDGCERVRGLFSASQIARQLSMELEIAPVARSFAEIRNELTH